MEIFIEVSYRGSGYVAPDVYEHRSTLNPDYNVRQFLETSELFLHNAPS
jgi:hypothetical protein